jgi:hypothetical protein
MGIISQDQLEKALDVQQSAADVEQLLGRILVAVGVCTVDQIEKAMNTQKGLRSKKLNEQALASLTIAEARKKNMRNANLDMIYKGTKALKRVHGLDLTPVFGIEHLTRTVK